MRVISGGHRGHRGQGVIQVLSQFAGYSQNQKLIFGFCLAKPLTPKTPYYLFIFKIKIIIESVGGHRGQRGHRGQGVIQVLSQFAEYSQNQKLIFGFCLAEP